jgi:hypothetical protein
MVLTQEKELQTKSKGERLKQIGWSRTVEYVEVRTRVRRSAVEYVGVPSST